MCRILIKIKVTRPAQLLQDNSQGDVMPNTGYVRLCC